MLGTLRQLFQLGDS